MLNNCLLRRLFLFLYALKILSVLKISQLVCIFLHLSLLLFEAFSLKHYLLDAIELIVVLNLEHVILSQLLHRLEHLHCEAAR